MTLDDLIALNDEIIALVRAGVPLEAGLAELGGDLPGSLGRCVAKLAQRTARGESLAQAIAADAGQLPPAYRAVVEAGIRSGRLPSALESIAVSARRLAETYRLTTLTAAYPMLIVLTAWCGLLFFVCFLAPHLLTMFQAFDVPGQPFFAAMTKAGRYVWYWGPIVPAFLLLLIVGWRLHCVDRWRCIRRLSWLPWGRRMIRDSHTATFLEMLALLVQNQTPLPEAVTLAGDASGDPGTIHAARQMAHALQDGQSPTASDRSTFPPLVKWLLLCSGRENVLLPAIQHAAASYHRRARYQSDMLRLFLPVILTVLVGGLVTAVYALALCIPYVLLLHSLAW